MVKFVVITRQRSGSKMLVECLTSHPRIECYGAIFWVGAHKDLIFVPPGRKHMSYVDYRNASLARRFSHLFQRKRLVDQFLTEFFSMETDSDALGFKLMYYQMVRTPAIVEWIKAHDLKVIHLIRQNLLRTLISAEVAHVRGVSHSTKHLGLYKVRPDPARLKAQLNKLSRLIERYRQTFATQDYMELGYESFVALPEVESRRLIEFLGVEPVMTLRASIVKQNPYPLSQVLDNYEEVAQVLKGTVYERFLLEDQERLPSDEKSAG